MEGGKLSLQSDNSKWKITIVYYVWKTFSVSKVYNGVKQGVNLLSPANPSYRSYSVGTPWVRYG